MTRLLTSAGSASAATSFTIALARFALVIAGILLYVFSFVLFVGIGPDNLPARLSVADRFKSGPALFGLHARLDGVQIELSGLSLGGTTAVIRAGASGVLGF